MRDIAATRVRYGYRQIHVLLRREGWTLSRNAVWRLYREEGLALRSKRPRRRKMVVQREARCMPTGPNEVWSLDFIHDQLSGGTKFRALTVVDVFSREGLAIEVGQRLKAEHVVEVLNRLVGQRGRHATCLPITGRSSPGTWSTFGHTGARCGSTSRGRASQPTTRSSRRSMARCGTNA